MMCVCFFRAAEWRRRHTSLGRSVHGSTKIVGFRGAGAKQLEHGPIDKHSHSHTAWNIASKCVGMNRAPTTNVCVVRVVKAIVSRGSLVVTCGYDEMSVQPQRVHMHKREE